MGLSLEKQQVTKLDTVLKSPEMNRDGTGPSWPRLLRGEKGLVPPTHVGLQTLLLASLGRPKRNRMPVPGL